MLGPVLMGLLFWSRLVWAGPPETILLAWDASVRAESYRLYYGEASGPYTVVLDVGPAVTASVAGLKPGQRYRFAVTAVNAAGESPLSLEVIGRPR